MPSSYRIGVTISDWPSPASPRTNALIIAPLADASPLPILTNRLVLSAYLIALSRCRSRSINNGNSFLSSSRLSGCPCLVLLSSILSELDAACTCSSTASKYADLCSGKQPIYHVCHQIGLSVWPSRFLSCHDDALLAVSSRVRDLVRNWPWPLPAKLPSSRDGANATCNRTMRNAVSDILLDRETVSRYSGWSGGISDFWPLVPTFRRSRIHVWPVIDALKLTMVYRCLRPAAKCRAVAYAASGSAASPSPSGSESPYATELC